jgi:hypothetical protein
MRIVMAIAGGALGLAIVVGLAVAIRGEPARPALDLRRAGPKSDPPGAPVLASTAVVGGPNGLQERLRALEERVGTLSRTRQALQADNLELKKRAAEAEAAEKNEAESRALSEQQFSAMEQAAINHWAELVNATEAQRAAYQEMNRSWRREDRDRAASPDVWQARELALRAILNSDQASVLHKEAVSAGSMNWRWMPTIISSMAGVTDQNLIARMSPALGAIPSPAEEMILPGAHGYDMPGLSREAAARLRSFLTAEQAATLDRKMK